MDTITLYKHRIDALMDILFGAGVSNPQTIIEQLNYLLFLRALSIKDDEAELLGITDESEKIFTGDLTKYRWQNLLTLNAEDLFKTLEVSFDVLQKKSKNPTVKLLFRNAHIKIFDKPTLRRVLHELEMFAKELDAIAHEGNKDVFGDMYEYLLSKLSSAGTNGQFRTPRHIIDFMVKVVDPKKNETILDPACGTAGFLVAAYRYIAGEYTSDKLKKAGSPRAMDKLSAEEKNFMFNHTFTGFDSDEDMIKFGMMNLHLHGLSKSHLDRQNTLTDTAGFKGKFDVVLANPPFSGAIDKESVTQELQMGTNATEVLFLRFMLDHLSLKGKVAVVVPEGLISNDTAANKKVREMLLDAGLWAIVSLPSGVFRPYASVKTYILLVDAQFKTEDKVALFEVRNDGFSLNDTRLPIDKNDLPRVLEDLKDFKENKKIKDAEDRVTISKKQIKKDPYCNLSFKKYWKRVKYKTDWSIKILGECCEIEKGKSPALKTKAGPYPLVATAEERRSSDHFDFDGEAVCIPLISSSGHGKASIKRLHYINGKFALANILCAVFPKDKTELDAKYLYLFLLSHKDDVLVPLMKGAANVSMKVDDLKTVEIPIPPIELQRKVVNDLEEIELMKAQVQVKETQFNESLVSFWDGLRD